MAKKDAAETKKLAEQLLAQATEQGIDLGCPAAAASSGKLACVSQR